MRVVAGSARGRRLVAPPGLNVRPTAERVRQATFNALEHRGAIRDAVVVDLFAGSGGLGIEALSRGATHATFVESDKAALGCIRQNLDHLGFADRATVVRGDVARWVESTLPLCDLLLVDPPYTFDGWGPLLKAARPRLERATPDERGIAVIETAGVFDAPAGWEVVRQQRYGGTVVSFLVPDVAPGNSPDSSPDNITARPTP